MAELYERFVALYPYPHERIRHGAPRAELNRRYLEHLYEGKNRGTTPIVVALDPTLLGTIENNVSLRTSTPVQNITADTVERYAHDLITDQHHYLDQVGVEVAAHEAFRQLNESAYLQTYRLLMENGELGEDDIGTPLKAEYPFELTAGIINEKVKATDIDSAAELLIMDLPLRDVSGVFAYLPFGGWDSSPSPEAMLSIARYWFERDDAYPAVIARTLSSSTRRCRSQPAATPKSWRSSIRWFPRRCRCVSTAASTSSWRRSTVSTTGTCGGSSSRRCSSLKRPKPA